MSPEDVAAEMITTAAKLVVNDSLTFSSCFNEKGGWPKIPVNAVITFRGIEYTANFMRDALRVEPFKEPIWFKLKCSEESALRFASELGVVRTDEIDRRTFRGILFEIDPSPTRTDMDRMMLRPDTIEWKTAPLEILYLYGANPHQHPNCIAILSRRLVS